MLSYCVRSGAIVCRGATEQTPKPAVPQDDNAKRKRRDAAPPYFHDRARHLPQRCKGCGHMVYMPCVKCGIENGTTINELSLPQRRKTAMECRVLKLHAEGKGRLLIARRLGCSEDFARKVVGMYAA